MKRESNESHLFDINRITIILRSINSSPSKHINGGFWWVKGIPKHSLSSVHTRIYQWQTWYLTSVPSHSTASSVHNIKLCKTKLFHHLTNQSTHHALKVFDINITYGISQGCSGYRPRHGKCCRIQRWNQGDLCSVAPPLI